MEDTRQPAAPHRTLLLCSPPPLFLPLFCHFFCQIGRHKHCFSVFLSDNLIRAPHLTLLLCSPPPLFLPNLLKFICRTFLSQPKHCFYVFLSGVIIYFFHIIPNLLLHLRQSFLGRIFFTPRIFCSKYTLYMNCFMILHM